MTDDLHPACRAVVLTCIDYRCAEPLRGLLAERGLINGADLVAWPGGALRLVHDPEPVLEVLELAATLHQPDEIVLAVHDDCGWLATTRHFDSLQDELAFLDESLESATDVAAERLPPGLRITTLRVPTDRSLEPAHSPR